MSAWKESVLRRFDAAAGTYDGHAGTQMRVAAALAERVLAQPLATAPEVLEIGCGTGFLTAALAPRLPGCRWLATDLAPNMVAACRRRALPGVELRVMDGEEPDLDGRRFDLIVSSLAVQWFADLPAGLARLHGMLRPGGVLALTTLGADTFPEWRRQCRGCGVEPGTPAYPTAAELRALGDVQVLRQPFPLRCGNLRGFLDHLRLTGARTAAPGHPGLSPAALGRLLKAGEAGPFTATYDVLTVVWRKES